MAKKPAFQFYPGDWRKDQDLSRASLQAKGALIEVLCLAFECEKRGYLMSGKIPWTIDEIAHAIGGDKIENMKAIEELLTKKILKIDKKKCIFSARMVRDEKLSKLRRRVGSMGGNPNLVNQTANQKPTPSSSSSTSVINIDIEKAQPEKWISKPGDSDKNLKLTDTEITQTIEFIHRLKKVLLTDKDVFGYWQAFKIQNFTGSRFYNERSDCLHHFRNWLKTEVIQNNKSSGKNGSEETHELPSRLTRLQ